MDKKLRGFCVDLTDCFIYLPKTSRSFNNNNIKYASTNLIFVQ